MMPPIISAMSAITLMPAAIAALIYAV